MLMLWIFRDPERDAVLDRTLKNNCLICINLVMVLSADSKVSCSDPKVRQR